MSFLRRLLGSSDKKAPDNRVVMAVDATAMGFSGRRRKIEVVGESFRQDALTRIAGKKTAQSKNITTVAALIPDPQNEHDSNAVEVRIDGEHVAYLSRAQAIAYHAAMKELGHEGRALANIEARIYGGWKDHDDEGSYGVALYLPDSIAKLIGYS